MSAIESHGRQMRKVYVIAEAGVNHNGSVDVAKKLIEVAAAAGADAVKFQTFKSELLVTKNAKTADYQKRGTGVSSQFEMLKKLELDEQAHRQLYKHAQSHNIQFLSTGFDQDSIRFLHHLGIPLIKVPSGEITNYPLLKTVSELGAPVILSTGMATMKEIGHSIEVLTSCGLSRNQITVLHCSTEYPTPMHHVNLLAMRSIKDAFRGIEVGYSDHTLGIEIAIAAAALGATVIEKHFTLDKTMAGPDHVASLGPAELSSMVAAIRNIEQALGDGKKQPTPSELSNREVARKSIVAACPIKMGESFTEQNLTTKRPGLGRSPMNWPELIGKPAGRAYETDEPID